MTPAEFLDLLWRQKTDGLHILIWVRQGKTSHWFRDIAAAADCVLRVASRDIYVGVGLSERDYGPEHRCKSEEIGGLAGLWADFDLQSEGHPKKPLPATIEDALWLIPDELRPTIIIATGNGVHVWWLFKQPWIFANDQERKEAAALSFRFQTLLRSRSSQRGWTFERLADLARVLRIPGTINAKDPENPKHVEAYSIEGRRYDPSEFRDYLSNLSIPDAEAEELAAAKVAERFSDQQIAINLGATISEDILAQWMQRDMRFRNTWNRQRPDLADQSGSGYDMALACFGARAGLTDQEIVDLIIHHRRIYGEQQRKTVDYFQRTISKARKTEVRVPMLSGQLDPGGGAAAAELDDAVKRATLCKQISRLLGVHLVRLLKLPGSDPVYLMELEQGRIEFDIKKLISHKSVSTALAAKTGKLIPTFRGKQWQELAQMMLDACTPVEGTDDLEQEGFARIQITKYLSEVPFIATALGATAQDRYKPVVHEGKIAVSATDMQMFLNRANSQNLTVKAIAAMLMAAEAVAVRVHPNSKIDQSRWALPVSKFDPKEYAPHREDGSDRE